MALLVVIFLSHGEASARTADSAPTSIRGASREYAPKPGDFTIHGTLYPNYRPGVLSVIPITGHPQVSMVVRVDETMFGESPWKAGEFLRFLVSDPDVLLAGRWRTRGQYAMTFSRFQPTTEDEKAWFKPETKYVLRSIAPVAAKAAPAREANSAGDANPAEGFESTEEAPDRAVLAMEFVDRETGWLLTVPSSAEGVPIEILRTQNGGSRFSSLGALDLTFAWLANWEQEPRTRPAVGQLRFLDRVHGWMFAPDLVATHDGGRTWSAEGRVVGALVPTTHAIWAIEGRYGKRVVIRSMDSGKSWVETLAQPPLADAVQLAAVDDQRAWILQEDPGKLFSTTDGGHHWSVSTPPRTDCLTSIISAGLDRTLWFVCGSEPATIMQGKAIFSSADGGATWTLRAETPLFEGTRKGTAPLCGHLGVQGRWSAVSARKAFMALGRGTLYMTNDGGTDWQESIPFDDVEGPGPLKFVSQGEGWITTREKGLLHTQDGGATWQAVWDPHGDVNHQ